MMHERIQTKFMALLLVALAPISKLKAWLDEAWALHDAHGTVGALDVLASQRADRAQSDIVGVAIALIVVGAVVFVGINIMSQTVSQTALTAGDPLYNASQSFQTTMGDMFGFIGLARLAAFLAVIIYYLTSVRGGGSGFGR